MKIKIQILAVVDQDTREDVKQNCDLKKVKAAVKEAAKDGEKSPIFRDGLKIVFLAWQRIYLTDGINGSMQIEKDERRNVSHWNAWLPL